MKCNFIELTETDDTKILLNVFHIAWIEPGKNGSVVRFNITNYSFSKKVKESYQEIKSMIGN
jgi:hypothetical protein